MKLRSIKYTGSKNGPGVPQRIISEMPLHSVYLEPFAGTGVIGRTKKPCLSTIYIDSDARSPIFTFYRSSPETKLLQIMDRNTKNDVMTGDIAICGDAISLIRRLKKYMNNSWLIYLDPPYLDSVRSYRRDYYRHEFKTDKLHLDLLTLLLTLPARVMISGYDSPLYNRTLKGWRKIEIPTVLRTGKKATQIVWMNFEEPLVYHDTRFLGKDFRERFRIKRKKMRWRKRLETMKSIDRAAVIAVIEDMINSSIV